MSFLSGVGESPAKEPIQETGCWSFKASPPERLTFGDRPLADYLQTCGLAWVIHLASYLRDLDWSAFREAYHARGRVPLHPRIIVGLVVYGFGQGINSWRGLEKLAARDLGAIYLCGGVCPDHSTIGNFILRHAEWMKDGLSEQILRDITAYFGLRFEELSGDGTVVQAWGSHYRALEKEAREEAQRKVEKKLEVQPQDEALQAQAEALAEAGEELDRRLDKKMAVGKHKSKTKIHPGEPEAVYQPLKNKAYRFAYKPLILASKQRFIVSHEVEPVKEAQGLEGILTGFEARTGRPLKRVMLDAAFLTQSLLEFGLAKEVDLLIPSGRADGGEWERKASPGGKDLKTSFQYDETQDLYRCPAGESLWPVDKYVDVQGRRVCRYRCRNARTCGRKEKCTKSEQGRSIKRYEFDDLKEALRKVMSQPGAKDRYRKRAGMVEPVFSSLREGQRLQRFQRQGLKKVRLEFALHALAYNLG
jgi:transposase